MGFNDKTQVCWYTNNRVKGVFQPTGKLVESLQILGVNLSKNIEANNLKVKLREGVTSSRTNLLFFRVRKKNWSQLFPS